MEFQIAILKAIQSVANPALDLLAVGISFLGEQLLVVPVAAFFFWCVDKELGYWTCWCASFTSVFTNAVKGILKISRPIGTPGIRSLYTTTATGYSFPSGHSTNSAALFYGTARALNRRRFWILALIVPALVALSRLYLGLHWPTDVVGGYGIGLLMPFLLWPLYRKFAGQKPLLFLLSTLVFLPFCFVLKEDALDFWKIFGFSLGTVLGSFLETRFVRFSTDGTPKQKALRFIFGLLSVGLLYLPMKLLLPATIPAVFFRYFVIPVYAMAGWPALFKKWKL